MLLAFLFLNILFIFANFLSALSVGDFVIISGLVNKPEYNGSIALVQRVSVIAGRSIVLKADDECMRNYAVEECMKAILIKNINLTPVKWNEPEKLPLQHLFFNVLIYGRFSAYVYRDISFEEGRILDRYATMIRKLCKDEPAELYRPKTTEKLRLIGAWINQNYDFHAMVYVCGAYEPLSKHIEWLWHEIGVWLH